MLKQALVILRGDADPPDLPGIATVSKDDAGNDGGYALGLAAARRGALWVDRPYFVGNPTVDWMVAKAERVIADGRGYVQVGNEQNHPDERWQGDAEGYQRFYDAVAARVSDPSRLLYQPPSPGFEDWRRWVGVGRAYAVHAYGDDKEMRETVQWYLDHTSGDLFVTECNPGAGNRFNLDAWAEGPFRTFLDWCALHVRIRMVAYFAHSWDQSPRLPSSIDARGTKVIDVLRSWSPPSTAAPAPPAATPGSTSPAPPPTSEEPPMAENPPRAELESYARLCAAPPRQTVADVLIAQIDQESGFRAFDEHGRPLPGAAGEVGIGQIIPEFHPWPAYGQHLDPADPWSAIRYMAWFLWYGCAERHGNALTTLLEYNGGMGAVDAWRRGEPYARSIEYVDNILIPALYQHQFDADGRPSAALRAAGIDDDAIASACGPIAAAALARSLGIDVDVVSVLALAPDYGWTPAGGMNGPANFERLCRALGVELRPASIEDNAWEGWSWVISTPKHFYFALRPSRISGDDELYVGSTGLARHGGREWMSLADISRNDEGLNAIWTGRRLAAAVAPEPAPEPERFTLAEVWAKVSPEVDGIWHESEALARARQKSRAVRIQRHVQAIKRTLGQEV